MFIFLGLVLGSAVLISGVVAVAYTATKIKNDLDAANSAIADLEASTDIVTSNVRNKVKLTSDGEKIIGLKDGSLVKAQSTLTTVDFDTTEYGDRAVLQLRNDTGSAITLTGLSIRGKPVKQLSGANGYVWEYSDYDDIEKNGENFVEVSNDFIFSPLQAKSIGDFVWKELHPHKMYSLTLIGTQYQYEIGRIWHLTLSYSLDGHTMEDIDTDVEVMGVSLSRSVGGVGTTALSLRVPSAAWELTLAKNAKLVGAGNSQRLANRSNIVTVASSTWTGQADYFCDGTDDYVEIQEAINYINSIGGGDVFLTSGVFNDAGFSPLSGVNIRGMGNSTMIYGGLSISSESNITLSDFAMHDGYLLIIQGASTNNINIKNIYKSSHYGITIYAGNNISIYNCEIIGASTGIDIYSASNVLIDGCNIYYCDRGIGTSGSASVITVSNCSIYNNTYDGILCSAGAIYRATFVNNSIHNNGGRSINTNGIGYCVFTGNKCFSNGTDTPSLATVGGTTNLIDNLIG